MRKTSELNANQKHSNLTFIVQTLQLGQTEEPLFAPTNNFIKYILQRNDTYANTNYGYVQQTHHR
jgi:hypothetical protein